MILCFLLVACDGNALSGTSEETPIPAVAFESITTTSPLLSFKIYCSVPTPAWICTGYLVLNTGNGFEGTIYGRPRTNDSSPRSDLRILVNVEAPRPTPGVYPYHFWQSDSTSLDTIITIQ
jgi:hypothetical protein